jgi:single-strand DNA-binding protein
MSLNKAMLIGNLGKDPELKMTGGGIPVCQFSIATTERRRDGTSGQWVDHTEWHNIVTFGKVAENCSKYLKKGSQVFIDGRIQTRKWQDKEGKDRYTTEIIGNSVQFLSRATGSQPSAMVENDSSFVPQESGKSMLSSLPSADDIADVSFEDDDIPF